MRTFFKYTFAACLLVLTCSNVSARAYAPLFPPDPGELYIPPTVTVFGKEVEVDSTQLEEDIDVLGDSTMMYNAEDNSLTFTNVNLEAGDSLAAAISYTGTDPLTIYLCDSSTIFADTVITSTADVVITGDGILVAEAVVPIIGTPQATITFDSVTMYVRSLPSPEAVRRRIRGVKLVDEDGGPALSGFASADFNKTSVTPPDAEYGEVETESQAPGQPPVIINALYVEHADGSVEVLTEFVLTGIADDFWEHNALGNTRSEHKLDTSKPMYNILGIQVNADYKGVVIQDGYKYIIR